MICQIRSAFPVRSCAPSNPQSIWFGPAVRDFFFAPALIFIVTMQTTRKCETASQILNDSKSVTGYGCKDVTFELIQQQKLTGKYYSPSFPTLHVGCMFTRLCYSGDCSGFTTGRGTHVCQWVRRNSSQYDEVQRIPYFCVHSNAQKFVYTHCGHDCHDDLGVLLISLTDFFPPVLNDCTAQLFNGSTCNHLNLFITGAEGSAVSFDSTRKGRINFPLSIMIDYK